MTSTELFFQIGHHSADQNIYMNLNSCIDLPYQFIIRKSIYTVMKWWKMVIDIGIMPFNLQALFHTKLPLLIICIGDILCYFSTLEFAIASVVFIVRIIMHHA